MGALTILCGETRAIEGKRERFFDPAPYHSIQRPEQYQECAIMLLAGGRGSSGGKEYSPLVLWGISIVLEGQVGRGGERCVDISLVLSGVFTIFGRQAVLWGISIILEGQVGRGGEVW